MNRPPSNDAGGGNRPGLTPGSRPGLDAPGGAATRPSPGAGLGGKPGVDNKLPGAGAGVAGGARPGVGNQLPGSNRPAAGAGRPGGARPATLPGLAAGGLAGAAVADRMQGGVGNRMQNRPNWNERPGSRQDFVNDRMQNRGERATNLQDRMSQRSDSWQDRRDQWQEGRGDRWEDFQDNFWDNAYDMRHDYWDNRFDAWWDHMWDEHPGAMAWGMTAWGVNRLSYWFGYGGGYYNPYCSEPVAVGGGGYCDYSQPLQTYDYAAAPAAPSETAPADQPASSPVNDLFNAAQAAFYAGDYDGALKSVNEALGLAKNDAVLHEFRSLVLFAQGKYRDSAAAIHSVLAVGPGWNWSTLIGLYPGIDTYTAQLRQLEDAVKKSPDDAALHLLLAYHYITTSANEPAIHQLQEVIRLQPKDTVAVQLLQMIGGPEALPAQLATAEPPQPATMVQLASSDVVGTWKAASGKSTFELMLTDKNTFSWSFEDGGKKTTVDGVFAINGNTLAMEPDAGGSMAAELTKLTGAGFHFAVVGSPPGDKGLDFKKG
ncbi:MAG TPA: tetratricopeptide repeat protein [Caulifigura sp.]|nr:tetratricopeptide repeat protein [Caulifigura sp.]